MIFHIYLFYLFYFLFPFPPSIILEMFLAMVKKILCILYQIYTNIPKNFIQ